LIVLRDAFFIARKDVQYMMREKETVLWVFIMPILFFAFIGTVTAGFGSRADSAENLEIIGGEGGGFLMDQLERRLEERGYAVERKSAETERSSRRLTVPEAMTDSVLAGVPVTLRYAHEAEGFGSDYENVRVGRAVYTLLADLVVTRSSGDTVSAETLQRLSSLERSVAVDVKSAGKRKEIPNGFEQAIPGTMVMFTLLVLTTSGAVLLVIERGQGLLRRLAYTPISRTSIVLGKWGGKMVLGMVQIGFAMLTGSLLFKMDWGPDLAAVVLVMLAYGGLMAGIGLLLGSFARTEGQAVATGVLSANVLGALGGCWWPIEITPPAMQKLQLFLPTGWAMDALHRLVTFASGPSSVLPHVVGMTAAALALLLFAARIFRFD
jgi:ABC-type multidrug transport system permease subunit